MLESIRNKQKIVFNVTVGLICVGLLIAGVAFGYSNYLASVQTQQTQSALRSQIDALNRTNSELQESNSQLKSQLDSLQSQIQDQVQQQFQSQLEAMKNNLTLTQSKLSIFEAQLNTPQPSKPQPVEPYNYLVYSNTSGSYLAQNGLTSAVDYSGNNATKVIQSCIDSLLSGNGGKIILAGTINLDGPLIITQGKSNGTIEIAGYGPFTQLVIPDKKDGIVLIGNQAFGYGGPYHAVIKDLLLTTGNSPQGNSMENGIYIENWFDVSIQNVLIFYANNSGVQIRDSADVKLQNVYVEGCGGVEYGGTQPLSGAGISVIGSKDCFFDNVYSDTNMVGFLFKANPQTNNLPNNIFLSQCEATFCQQTGMSIGSTNGLVLANSLIQGSCGDGVNIVDSFNINLASTIIQGNSGNGVVINSAALNLNQSLIKIQNCNIDANGKNGLGVYSQNNMTIGGVSILGCQITNSGASFLNRPAQPYLWDGININTDSLTGGNCRNIQISNCFVGNVEGTNLTQKYGVRSMGNTDHVQVLQNIFFNNLEGNYSLVGNHNLVANNF